MAIDGSGALLRGAVTAALALTLALFGCSEEHGESAGADVADEGAAGEDVEEADLALSQALKQGKYLYDKEKFGGNGRTCLTCHSRKTGTLNPEQVQDRFDDDPDDPLFAHDGSDDFQGNGTSRIREDATILVRLPLPPNVHLADDPAATSVVVRRGIPTTVNTPALDPVLMLDGRASSLADQADGAIHGHAEATVEPTDQQLDLIAAFEKGAPRFFSSKALRLYAAGGPPPALPKGHTAAEKRGRKWFVDAPVGPTISSASPRDGLCALCHSGPMLDQTNQALADLAVPFSAPAGTRFRSALVSELNTAQNPVHDFVVEKADGTTVTVSSPDPGRALITGVFISTSNGALAPFKIPQLRGIRETAPYFHDNSAKTLADVVDHYAAFFVLVTGPSVDGDAPLVMTSQDRKDLVAYMRLL